MEKYTSIRFWMYMC